ncbi:hypothetical protein LWI29_017032 [Acer saccharum]|uniref:SURP motif domain-containing protein n=1 Tax=Acer saccharum TaxID=4024 RepID=A0AA39W753_ACESA|nr:hypothetical protein LWI29_017032 [Acer saccharum]
MLGALPILPLPAPPSDGDLGPLPPSQVTEQQKEEIPVSEEQSKANSTPTSVATHTRTIGIIHPPPDIRNIVDKTSQFVAKNGPEFEKRIIANNANNAKFIFLCSSDPYHAYCQHRRMVVNCFSGLKCLIRVIMGSDDELYDISLSTSQRRLGLLNAAAINLNLFALSTPSDLSQPLKLVPFLRSVVFMVIKSQRTSSMLSRGSF